MAPSIAIVVVVFVVDEDKFRRSSLDANKDVRALELGKS